MSEIYSITETYRNIGEYIVMETCDGTQSGGRIEYLDIAKGIGIILVVWAHASGPKSNYIEQFHMPFFFFLSGILYREGRSLRTYCIHKLKVLLVPFWQWNLLMFPLFFVLYYWKKWSVQVFIRGIVEIVLTLNKVPALGATWFLPALFWICITVHVLKMLCKNLKYSDIYLFCLGILACWIGLYVTFPYRISRTLVCGFFYICGHLYNKYLRNKYPQTAIGNIVKEDILAIFCGIMYVFIANKNVVSMGANQYKFKIAFVVGAFMATIFVLRVSMWLSTAQKINIFIKHLIYLGKNSISIVIWQFLSFRVAIIIQMLTMHISLNAIVAFPVYDASGLWWVLYLVSGIYVSLFWQYILTNIIHRAGLLINAAKGVN